MMKIKITGDNIAVIASLNNSAISKDFADRLPLTLKMYPHENRELYGSVDLPNVGISQDSYAVGDIAYWVPGRVLVFYYGPGHTGNLIKMGTITSGLEQLSATDKNVTVTIEKI